MEQFDIAYGTQISEFILRGKPQKAYEHIKNCGVFKNVEMQGCALIYAWLCHETSTIDATTIQAWNATRVQQLLDGLTSRWKNRWFAELMIEIEEVVSGWFATQMGEARMIVEWTDRPAPTWFDDFSEKVPADSPLSRRLNALLQEPQPPQSIEL